MAEFDLRIQVPNLPHSLIAGARVDVLPTARSSGREQSGDALPERKAIHGQLVNIEPAGVQATGGHRVSGLDSGRYMVRAELPSGVVIEQSVELTDDKPAQVFMIAGESRHEWMAYGQVTGSLRPSKKAGTRSVGAQEAVDAKERFSLGASVSADRTQLTCLPLLPSPAVWGSLLAPMPLTGPGPSWQRTQQDENTQKWIQTAKTMSGLDALIVGGAGVPDGWAIIAPRGWPSSSRASFELTLPSSEESPAASGPVLEVSDQYFGSAMAWMRRGNVGVARDIVRSVASEMLEGKFENPYAAALGAHLLCETENVFDSSLKDWIQNLDEYFPWLPDGTVVRAYILTRSAASESERDEAVRTANLAFDRGVPLYTSGVQRLLDVYMMLEEHVRTRGYDTKCIEKCDTRLRAVSTVLGRMRTDRVFSTVRRDEPDSQR